jgi:hypothetical protein
MTNRPKNLTPQLTQRLLAYAVVAGAVTACSSHADAEVIFTPVDSKVNGNFEIDLNHDGINDFHVSSYYFSGFGHLSIKPAFSRNLIVSTPELCGFTAPSAAALPVGALIEPGLPFQSVARCMAYDGGGTYFNGPWLYVKGRYLGFAFVIDGKEHFGWARLNMNYWGYDQVAEVLGFAYETIPNKPILAGDTGDAADAFAEPVPEPATESAPATLGALAAGAPALASWKKEQAGAPALNSWRKEETKP